MYKQMYEKIKQANVIYIYRHVASDYDALGSQFGLKEIIEDNFVNKKVVCMGEVNEELFAQMKISYSKQTFKKCNHSLAIVLDTANINRIDGEGYLECDDLIKVDHHIVVDRYGKINIEDEKASSTSELICRFYSENKKHLNLFRKAATYLYYGIVGDTNRFMYDGTTSTTLKMAGILLDAGINREEIYSSMYVKGIKDLEVQKFILNNYVFDEGIAYYILNQKDLDMLDITREQGSNYVNVLSNISEIKVWMAITYQKEKDNYRVSLRSRNVPVQPTASKFSGGGHVYASGATLESLDDLSLMIQSLKEEMTNEI